MVRSLKMPPQAYFTWQCAVEPHTPEINIIQTLVTWKTAFPGVFLGLQAKGNREPESCEESTLLLRTLFGIYNPKAWTLKSFSWARSLGTTTPSHLIYGILNAKREKLCQKHLSLGVSTLRASRHPIVLAIPPNQGDAGDVEAQVSCGPTIGLAEKYRKVWQALSVFLCNFIKTELSPQHCVNHKALAFPKRNNCLVIQV